MLVDKGPHTVEKSFENGWGNTWTEGIVVIRGIGMTNCNALVVAHTIFEMISL